jgi:ABC-type sugar transport system ATPase subunit
VYFRPEEFTIANKHENATRATIEQQLFYGNHHKLKLNTNGKKLDMLVWNTSLTVGEEISIEFNSTHR